MNHRPLLTSDRFPYLPIQVEVRQQTYDVEALLDTGFDGDVILPPELIINGRPPDGYQHWRLADESLVVAPYYMGTLRLGTTELPSVMIVAMGDEPLVGRGILTDFTVILDHAQRLIVEP